MKSVIIAYANENFASQLKRVLTENFIHVVSLCDNGSAVLHIADSLDEAVVICQLILPDMPAHHLAEMLPSRFNVLALSKRPASFNGNSNLEIMTLPLKKDEFVCEITRLCISSAYIAPTRKRGNENRPLIEKAKSIIMAKKGISEDLAHKHLQHISMTHGKKIVETAKEIINNEIKNG